MNNTTGFWDGLGASLVILALFFGVTKCTRAVSEDSKNYREYELKMQELRTPNNP